MNMSPYVRTLIGRLSVWAQVNHPVRTANLMRTLTSSSSSKKKHGAAEEPQHSPRIAGLGAADKAAGVPTTTSPEVRRNGVALANQAARIPGCF